MKNLILESIKIIKDVKWDYATMAQLTKLWGGPKKATTILISLGTVLGAITTLSFQKLYKHFLSKLQTSKKKTHQTTKSTKLFNEKQKIT